MLLSFKETYLEGYFRVSEGLRAVLLALLPAWKPASPLFSLCHPATFIFPEQYFGLNVLSISWQLPYIFDHPVAAKCFVALLDPGKLRQCSVTQSDPLNLFTVKAITTSGTFYFPVSIMHFSMCSSALKSIPTLLLFKFPKFSLLWTSSLHFLIIKSRGKCRFHFRPHQLASLHIENKWAKIDRCHRQIVHLKCCCN